MKKEYNFSKARRGTVVPLKKGKTRITIRIDNDILDWFRNKVHESGGGNYQTLMNKTLRTCIFDQDKGLEETLRRVIKEELELKMFTLQSSDNLIGAIDNLDSNISDYKNKIEKKLINQDRSINKTTLIATVADEAKIGKADAKKTVEAFLRFISSNLKEKGHLPLAGLGTLVLSEKKPRTRLSPTIKDRVRVIRFRDKNQVEESA